MKITLVGPGIMPIPPTGWGAVEILIWDTKVALEELGHEVNIVNTKDPNQIIQQINNFRPDFVHVHYDDFINVYPYIQYPKAITSHFGYLEQPERFGSYSNIFNYFNRVKPNIFCLSPGIAKIYSVLQGVPDDKLFVTPNGVNSENFKKVDKPSRPDDTIYLAKIDYRKRQHLYQSIDSLYYAGNNADSRFNTNLNYLGEWDKQTLYENLTEFGSLALISDGEAHPLVCMEAMSAGLGLVISEFASANLDTSKKFIDVIPKNKMDDVNYIEDVIIENRNYSVKNRDEIFEYSKEFEWKNVIKKYYLPNVKIIVDRS